jgi:hypothetical protein
MLDAHSTHALVLRRRSAVVIATLAVTDRGSMTHAGARSRDRVCSSVRPATSYMYAEFVQGTGLTGRL